jgi:hypothetical protein
LNVPLQFWFCRNPALALPLVAMSLHEVRLQIEFNGLEEITSSYVPTSVSSIVYRLTVPKDDDVNKYSSGQTMECQVWATYYHLDADERRAITQTPLEYLIETVQHKGGAQYRDDTLNIKYDIPFANPVKEIIWGLRPFLDIPNTDLSGENLTYRTRLRPSFSQFWSQFESGVIKFNGQNRMKDRPDTHFLLTQNYQHHTRASRYDTLTGATYGSDGSPWVSRGSVYSTRLYTYSFGLAPEQYQPSGAANFTKLDDAQLELRGISTTDPISWATPTNALTKYFSGLELMVYATGYNVLRVKDGMAGLAYEG